MVFSPTPTVLLANLQADHSDRITSAERVSQPPTMEEDAEPTLLPP